MTSGARHGTLSGWSAHQRRGESTCDACYRAKAAYDAALRAAPERQARARQRARAQRRALTRLVRAYPALYRALYQEEKGRVVAEDEARAPTEGG